MKKKTRRKFSSAFKARVALEAAKNQLSLADLARKFEVSPVIISRWKAEFLENISAAFEKEGDAETDSAGIQELYAQIGRLKVENEFLKKSCSKLGI
jgi:transposase-like protein